MRDVLELHNLFHQSLDGNQKFWAKQAQKYKNFQNFLRPFFLQVMWSQLNCFILIKTDYIFHTKGCNNIKVSKENTFQKSL